MAARRKDGYGGWRFDKMNPVKYAGPKMVRLPLDLVNTLLAKEALSALAAELNSLDRTTAAGKRAVGELVIDFETGQIRVVRKTPRQR